MAKSLRVDSAMRDRAISVAIARFSRQGLWDVPLALVPMFGQIQADSEVRPANSLVGRTIAYYEFRAKQVEGSGTFSPEKRQLRRGMRLRFPPRWLDWLH